MNKRLKALMPSKTWAGWADWYGKIMCWIKTLKCCGINGERQEQEVRNNAKSAYSLLVGERGKLKYMSVAEKVKVI